MSLFIPPLIFLFFFPGFAVAGLYDPNCSSTTTTYPSSSLPPPPVYSTTSTSTAPLPSYTVSGPSYTTSSIPGPIGYSVGGHSSHTGTIAGCTVAGVAVISTIVAALFFYRKRRRSQAQCTSAGDEQGCADNQYLNQVPPQPMSGQETVTSSLPGASAPLSRTYNPEDRSTSPEYQGTPNTRHLYTVDAPPSSEARG